MGSRSAPVLAHRREHFNDFGRAFEAEARVDGVGRDMVGASRSDDVFFTGNRELQPAFRTAPICSWG